jgi:hypothetical protein
MRWWKVLGLAGAAGVAATGVVIVQAERKRRAYTPDQVRDQLHARLAEQSERSQTGPAPEISAPPSPITLGLLVIRDRARQFGRSLAARRRSRHTCQPRTVASVRTVRSPAVKRRSRSPVMMATMSPDSSTRGAPFASRVRTSGCHSPALSSSR